MWLDGMLQTQPTNEPSSYSQVGTALEHEVSE